MRARRPALTLSAPPHSGRTGVPSASAQPHRVGGSSGVVRRLFHDEGNGTTDEDSRFHEAPCVVCHTVTDHGDELMCEGQLCLLNEERNQFAPDASVACRRCLCREYGYATINHDDTDQVSRQRQLDAEPPWICPRCVAAVLLPLPLPPLPSLPPLSPLSPLLLQHGELGELPAAAAATAAALSWFQDPELDSIIAQDDFDWLFHF